MSYPINPATLGNGNVAGFSIFGPTRVTTTPSAFSSSSSTAGPSTLSSVTDAFKVAASSAARIFVLGPSAPLQDAAAKTADAAADGLKAGAAAVAAAGSGIYSGFRWAVVIVLLLAGVYVLALLAPLMPRGAR